MTATSLPSYKGRSLGIIVLIVAQVLIGIIHISSGFFLLFSKPSIYGEYTLAFGSLVLFFSYGLWNVKSWGRNGTLAVSAFVIAADFLALFNLPSIPGIPKLGAFGEIIYSLLIVGYLSQNSRFAQKPNKLPAAIKK
jgi:hypothetical protein